MSHPTLLAVAVLDGGYDCYEWPDRPRVPAPTLRQVDPPADRTVPDRAGVYAAVSPRRHEWLVVVPETGPATSYCTLSRSLDGFRAEPARSGPPPDSAGGYLVAAERDSAATELRRLWDGARGMAAVLVEECGCSPPTVDRLLDLALDRLTYDREVVGPIGGD